MEDSVSDTSQFTIYLYFIDLLFLFSISLCLPRTNTDFSKNVLCAVWLFHVIVQISISHRKLFLFFASNSVNIFSMSRVDWTLIIIITNNKFSSQCGDVSFSWRCIVIYFYILFIFLICVSPAICRTHKIVCVIRSKCEIELFCRQPMNGPFHLNKVWSIHTKKQSHTLKHTGYRWVGWVWY